MIKRFVCGVLLLPSTIAVASSINTVKQFEETSFYLRDVVLIDANTGWAVGAPHWDQVKKTYVGTIIKTEDGGATWNPQDAAVAATLRGVTFVDPNHGWAVGEAGTILHTNDGGDHWVQQEVETDDEFRAVAFADAQTGWATSIRPVHFDWDGWPDDWRGTVWHTSNGGATWQSQTLPDNASILNRIDCVDLTHCWIAAIEFVSIDYWPEHRNVVYATDDGGLNWHSKYPSEPGIVLTGIDFLDQNKGWAVGFKMNSGIDGGTVFRTTDGGQSWEQLEPDYVLWDVHFLDANQGYAVGTLYSSAWGPPVLRTFDGGDSWQLVIMDDQDDEGLFGIAIAGDHAVAVGDHDFVATSSDLWGQPFTGNAPELFEQRYINVHFSLRGVFFADAERGWAVGDRTWGIGDWGQIILNTIDGGASWRVQYAPPLDGPAGRKLVDISFADDNNGWAVGPSQWNQQLYEYRGAILHTTDAGATWTEQGFELLDDESWLSVIGLAALSKDEAWILVDDRTWLSTLYLAHTTNGGDNWQWVDTGIDCGGTCSLWNNGGLDFVDPLNGWAVGGRDVIVHTSDGGQSWVFQSVEEPLFSLNAVQFRDTQNGWICGYGLLRTTDGGQLWKPVEIPTENELFAIDFTDDLNGWISGEYGVLLRTTDGGDTWQAVESGTWSNLRDISFATPESGWAVGASGSIVAITVESSSRPTRIHRASGRVSVP